MVRIDIDDLLNCFCDAMCGEKKCKEGLSRCGNRNIFRLNVLKKIVIDKDNDG